MINEWLEQKWVREWEGAVVGNLREGTFTAAAGTTQRYVAVGGMRQLATHLARSVTGEDDVAPVKEVMPGKEGTYGHRQHSNSRSSSSSSQSSANSLVRIKRPMWVARMSCEVR